MFHFRLFPLALILVLIVGSSAVGTTISQQLLYETSIGIDESSHLFTETDFDLDLTFDEHPFVPTNPVTLFDDLEISSDDPNLIGMEFVANSSNDINFDSVADLLTNGLNEFYLVSLKQIELVNGVQRKREQGGSEVNLFQSANQTFPDLFGETIGKIVLRIDSFELDETVELSMTISFFAIPEPTSGGLAGIALLTTLGVGARRRTRKTTENETG